MARIPDAEVFLRKLKENGGACGNKALVEDLGWTEDKYRRVRDTLLDEGAIAKGRGRGGTVRLVVEESSAEPAPLQANPGAPVAVPQSTQAITLANAREGTKPPWEWPETELYEPFAEGLRNEWAQEERLLHCAVEITAWQGRRPTGGTWTRPDITVASKRTYTYLPGSYFDITTFELKPGGALDVTAIFEAAAHSRRATRSYAVFAVPEEIPEEQEETLVRCEAEARRFGVGLVTFSNPREFSTWDTRVLARRLDTNPELVDEFIAEQLGDEVKVTVQGAGGQIEGSCLRAKSGTRSAR